MLSVSDLCVDFRVGDEWVPAVHQISYQLQPGRVLAVVGESGSGKTASAMAIPGLLPDNARARGSVTFEGTELLGAPKDVLRRVRGSGIAMIFQEPMTALNPVYTVGEQIIETLRINRRSLSRDQAKRRALDLLRQVELPDPELTLHKYPHQLSGGQRQRAMIAQAISLDPHLLIADEPTTALDVTVQAEILDLLRRLHQKRHSAILLITHDMGVVADIADEVMVMKDGETVEYGEVAHIFAAPSHEYTKTLMGSVPHLGSGRSAATTEAATAPPASAATETQTAVALALDRVCVDYPKRGGTPAFRAVADATFQLRAGEVVGLVGESGSGKTTIARAIMGLIPIASGTLQLAGQKLTKATTKQLRAVRRRIGVVFQDPGSSLDPRCTVAESIAEPLVVSGRSRNDITHRVEQLLELVSLPNAYRDRFPHELSGGQRQRVGIARALALDPVVLIADEPTSALDVSVQARVLQLLQEIQRTSEFATLFVTHDLAVVDLLADRVIVMQRGRVIEQGDTNRVLTTPQHAYTQRLLAAVPVPDPNEQRHRRHARARLLATP